MKNCSDVRENISSYIDNELSADERSMFEEHIGICPDCRKEYDEVLRIVGFCRDMQDVELPENFRDELHIKLLAAAAASQDSPKSSILQRARYVRIFSSIAAGFILIFLVSGIYRFGFKHTDINYSTENISAASTQAAEPELPGKSETFGAAAAADESASGQYTIAGAVPTEQPAETVAPATDRSAPSDNRAVQAPMMAKATIAEAASNRTVSLTVMVDDPAAQIESIKALAVQTGGEEKQKVLVDSGVTATMDVAAASNDIVVTFSIPNTQYDSFAQALNKDFGAVNIEPGALVTEDLTQSLNSLITQSNDLDTRIKKLEDTDASANADTIKQLKAEKDAVQTQIEDIRLNTDFTTVTVTVKNK